MSVAVGSVQFGGRGRGLRVSFGWCLTTAAGRDGQRLVRWCRLFKLLNLLNERLVLGVLLHVGVDRREGVARCRSSFDALAKRAPSCRPFAGSRHPCRRARRNVPRLPGPLPPASLAADRTTRRAARIAEQDIHLRPQVDVRRRVRGSLRQTVGAVVEKSRLKPLYLASDERLFARAALTSFGLRRVPDG